MTLIIHEFINGPWDGRNLSNDSLDPVEIRQAVDLYLNTEQGREGKSIFIGGHEYLITNRTEVGNEVLVRFESAADKLPPLKKAPQERLRADPKHAPSARGRGKRTAARQARG